jgi:hypothetical protein
VRQRKKKPLKEGMVYCKSCKGNGLIKPYRIESLFGNRRTSNKCSKCNGIGQIDWIDNMLGRPPKKEPSIFDDFSSYLKNFRTMPIVTASQSKGKSMLSSFPGASGFKHQINHSLYIDYIDLMVSGHKKPFVKRVK